jgi:hypothetical protein
MMPRVDLARLVVAQGLAAPEAVARALAQRGDRSVVEALVAAGIAEEALADAAARSVGVAVVDLVSGALDPDVVRLVPSDVAWRYLAVAVAPEPGRDALQVAFADPLDDTAVQAVRDATGLDVTVLVATVSGVRHTLARAFGARGPASAATGPAAFGPLEDADPGLSGFTGSGAVAEVAPEPTRPLAAAPLGREPTLATAPSHRVAAEATLEQRHEALLLALVEAGVLTRAHYVEALRRLLRRD